MSTEQTIFRVASRHKPFSQLGNAMLRDSNLSLEARGALALILSYPENWTFDLPWMMRACGIGRDKARRIINEHVTHKYCARARQRNSDGTIGAYEYVFTDEPAMLEPETEKASVVTTPWKPVTGEPAPANTTTKTKRIPSKENPKDHRADARSGKNGKGDGGKPRPAQIARFVSEAALDRVRWIAPDWDRQALLAKFLAWDGSSKAKNMDAAFLGWVPSYTKGKKPGAD